MLLRVFIGDRAHHHPGDFRGRLPDDELQIHTWMDATLKELAGLITEVDPDLIRPGTRFAFNQLFKNQYALARCHLHRFSLVSHVMRGW